MNDFQIKLIERNEPRENTVTFIFDISSIKYPFEAGQYAHFTLINPNQEDKKGHSRPFSIASSPDNKNKIMIAARKDSSTFVSNLLSAPLGSKIFISKPSGELKFHKNISVPAVFIAGGIGITPIRSIIEKEINSTSGRKMFLIYSNRTESQTTFLNDFEKWEKKNKDFKFIPVIEDTKNSVWKYEFGKINKKLLEKHIGEFEDKIYYLVGPPLMVDSIKNLLTKEGVEEEKIIWEKFR